MPPAQNRLVGEQVRRNLAADARWAAYASHRDEVTRRLLSNSISGGRLCVLGAGNSNDLDLAQLATAFHEVHLVDLDAEALERGVARQTDAPASAIYRHGGIDLLGALNELAALSSEPASDPSSQRPIEAELDRCLAHLGEPQVDRLPGPFDVVASVCLMSQLIESAVASLGESHSRFAELVLAIRTAHLRLLSRLLLPGGRAVLIADFVSSQTAAELRLGDPEWEFFLRQIAAERNFFHASHPAAILAQLQNDPLLRQTVTDARLTGCWRWDQGARLYAVAALEFSKHS